MPNDVPEQRFESEELRTKAEGWGAWLDEAHPDVAQGVKDSPAFGSLVVKLDELERDGNDAGQMLDEAIRDRELGSAQDPARVLAWRVDRTPEQPAQKILEDLDLGDLDVADLPEPVLARHEDDHGLDLREDDFHTVEMTTSPMGGRSQDDGRSY